MSNRVAVDDVLDALGDRTRRQIVERLRGGPMPVGELAGVLPVGRPAVSKHLRVLEGAGLVVHQSVGTRNLYALAPEGFTTLQQWLVQSWDQTLTAFANRMADLAGDSGTVGSVEGAGGVEKEGFVDE
jgi:DNA-binding transcriptional ArsR family regulator